MNYVAFIHFHDLNHDELYSNGYYEMTGNGNYTRTPDHYSIEFKEGGGEPYVFQVIDIMDHEEYGYTFNP